MKLYHEEGWHFRKNFWLPHTLNILLKRRSEIHYSVFLNLVTTSLYWLMIMTTPQSTKLNPKLQIPLWRRIVPFETTARKTLFRSCLKLSWLTNQNPPVTCDWSIGFTKLGISESSSSWRELALSMASNLASSDAYTRLSRHLLLQGLWSATHHYVLFQSFTYINQNYDNKRISIHNRQIPTL